MGDVKNLESYAIIGFDGKLLKTLKIIVYNMVNLKVYYAICSQET